MSSVDARRVALVVLSVFAGCRDTAFQRARRVDTIETWRSFLEQRPTDANVEAAQTRLEELEFEEATQAHSLVGFKRHLEKYPEGVTTAKTKALLEGLRFNAAVGRGTPQALRGFLREHPDGAHASEVALRLEAAETEALASSTELSALTRAAQAHAGDAKGAIATARLDETSFAAATTCSLKRRYLLDFPAGAHRDEVKTSLLSSQLEGLLVSGLIEEAQALLAKSPLAAGVPDAEARLARAQRFAALTTARDPRVREALVTSHLRPIEELERAINSGEPLERWQAVEELGQHVSVRAINPLVQVLRTARSTLTRVRAFEALAGVLASLPPAVVECEVASRLETLEAQASDAQLYLSVAVLLDVSGQAARAAEAYQKAYAHDAPDPLVLWRWVHLRRSRGQRFSMAVAAKQLASWVQTNAKEVEPQRGPAAVWSARELCGVVELGRLAHQSLVAARGANTEFPEDVAAFSTQAEAALNLASAKLRDAELLMLEAEPRQRLCVDATAGRQVAAVTGRRLALLSVMTSKPPADWAVLREYLSTLDPAPAIRLAAAAAK